MDVQMLTQYFLRYGAVFIFVIILLEYMNLQDSRPGLLCRLQAYGQPEDRSVFSW